MRLQQTLAKLINERAQSIRMSEPAHRSSFMSSFVMWLPSLLIPALAIGLLGVASVKPSTWLFWFIPMVLFMLVPLLDALIGRDDRNPSDVSDAGAGSVWLHKALPLLFLPLQWGVLAASLALAWRSTLSWTSFAGLVVTAGAVNGLGIVAAHEIGHHAGKLAAAASRIALAPSCYGHFRIEHLRGHHRRVATREDPASARLGETFWHFLFRSVAGGATSAWRLETARLSHRGRSAWSLSNECLQSHVLSLIVLGSAWWFGNARVVLFIGLQAAYAISLLEAINYIEHYGLKRQTVAGKLERCATHHSWNCDNALTNRLLFNLQRHSDHHVNPARRYQDLRTDPRYPRLPTGYAGLVWAVYVPPLWSWLMDKRVLACYGGDASLANLHAPASAPPRKKWQDADAG